VRIKEAFFDLHSSKTVFVHVFRAVIALILLLLVVARLLAVAVLVLFVVVLLVIPLVLPGKLVVESHFLHLAVIRSAYIADTPIFCENAKNTRCNI